MIIRVLLVLSLAASPLFAQELGSLFDGSQPSSREQFKAQFLALKLPPAAQPDLRQRNPERTGAAIGSFVGLIGAGVPAGIWLSQLDRKASPTHGYLETAGAQVAVLASATLGRAIGRAIGRRAARKRAERERYYPPYSY